MELTVSNLTKVFSDCLWADEEVVGKSDEDIIAMSKVVDGIMNKFAFKPDGLERNKDNINSLISQLPEEFNAGMSFLSACMTKDGQHWGEHIHMDQLFCLGMAIDKVSLCMPRDFWAALPGGMPYYIVK